MESGIFSLGSRRERLNRWFEEFMKGYVPDKIVDIDQNQLVKDLLEIEVQKGKRLVMEEPLHKTISGESTHTYRFAAMRARAWNIPITQVGLMIAVFGCFTPDHVDLTLAVLQKAFVKARSGNPELECIDGEFVWETLRHGTISLEYYDKMLAVLEPNKESRPHIFDSAIASDFQ